MLHQLLFVITITGGAAAGEGRGIASATLLPPPLLPHAPNRYLRALGTAPGPRWSPKTAAEPKNPRTRARHSAIRGKPVAKCPRRARCHSTGSAGPWTAAKDSDNVAKRARKTAQARAGRFATGAKSVAKCPGASGAGPGGPGEGFPGLQREGIEEGGAGRASQVVLARSGCHQSCRFGLKSA